MLDLTSDVPSILRPGGITLEMLRTVLPGVQLVRKTVHTGESAASPGLHWRHYAPRTPAYRFEREHWPEALAWAMKHAPVALLTWSDDIVLPAPHHTVRLPENDHAYARVLYRVLRETDELGVKAMLLLATPSESGLWAAIADRIRRATEALPASAPTHAPSRPGGGAP